ncbi:MAG: hypothetical protein ACTSUF_09720 [Candidatus Heimdallarchaeaceae archaeon]
MQVKKLKSYISQKCNECGLPAFPTVFVVTPERAKKSWRLCEICFDRVFVKKALRQDNEK